MKHKKQSQGSFKKANEYIWGSNLAFLDNFTTTRPLVLQKRNTDSSQSNSPYYILSQSPQPTPHQEEESQPNENKYNLAHFDSTDYLFLSYAETFKTFPLRRQCLLKIELAKLFANAELEHQNTSELEDPMVIKTEVTPFFEGPNHNNNDFEPIDQKFWGLPTSNARRLVYKVVSEDKVRVNIKYCHVSVDEFGSRGTTVPDSKQTMSILESVYEAIKTSVD